ncbi:hypothetical protein ACWCOV_02440 [Kribbella sp. NPDC002412]
MPATLLLGALLTPLLTPWLLLVGATALLRGTLPPAALTALLALPLSGALVLGRLARLRPARLLLTPTTAALLRRLPLLRRLLWLLRALTPTATTLAGRLLLSPAAPLTGLASLPRLLPARLAPRLPRTPRSLWRRRHIRSF